MTERYALTVTTSDTADMNDPNTSWMDDEWTRDEVAEYADACGYYDFRWIHALTGVTEYDEEDPTTGEWRRVTHYWELEPVAACDQCGQTYPVVDLYDENGQRICFETSCRFDALGVG